MRTSVDNFSSGEVRAHDWFMVTGSLALLPGALYWSAVVFARIYERTDFVFHIWPVLRIVLPAIAIFGVAAIFVFGVVAWRWLLGRNGASKAAVGLWLLSAGLSGAVPVHFFWVAGAGI